MFEVESSRSRSSVWSRWNKNVIKKRDDDVMERQQKERKRAASREEAPSVGPSVVVAFSSPPCTVRWNLIISGLEQRRPLLKWRDAVARQMFFFNASLRSFFFLFPLKKEGRRKRRDRKSCSFVPLLLLALRFCFILSLESKNVVGIDCRPPEAQLTKEQRGHWAHHQIWNRNVYGNLMIDADIVSTGRAGGVCPCFSDRFIHCLTVDVHHVVFRHTQLDERYRACFVSFIY